MVFAAKTFTYTTSETFRRFSLLKEKHSRKVQKTTPALAAGGTCAHLLVPHKVPGPSPPPPLAAASRDSSNFPCYIFFPEPLLLKAPSPAPERLTVKPTVDGQSFSFKRNNDDAVKRIKKGQQRKALKPVSKCHALRVRGKKFSLAPWPNKGANPSDRERAKELQEIFSTKR